MEAEVAPEGRLFCAQGSAPEGDGSRTEIESWRGRFFNVITFSAVEQPFRLKPGDVL